MAIWAAGRKKVNQYRKAKNGDYFTFRLQTNEVPKIVVRRLALRNLVMGLGFDGVNQIRELD